MLPSVSFLTAHPPLTANLSQAALLAGTSHACPSIPCKPTCPFLWATHRTTSGACTRCKSYPSQAQGPAFGLDCILRNPKAHSPCAWMTQPSRSPWEVQLPDTSVNMRQKREVSSGFLEPTQDIPLELDVLMLWACDMPPAASASTGVLVKTMKQSRKMALAAWTTSRSSTQT